MPKNLRSFVWYFLKSHRWALSVFAVVTVVWSIELSLSPYLLKMVIDGVIRTEASPDQMLAVIILPAILYPCMSIIINLNFRMFDYTCLKIFPKIRADIVTSMFEYLSKHSHRYFAQHFSGNLSKKIFDLYSGIEPIIQIPNTNFIPVTIATMLACLVMYSVHPIFCAVLSLWTLFFVSISYKLSKRSEALSYALSETDNQLGGNVVDSISNMISAKIFSNTRYEKALISDAALKLIDKDRKLQMHMLKTFFVQGLMVTALSASMMAGLVYGRLQSWVSVGDFALVLNLSGYIIMNVWNVGKEMIRFSKEVGKCKQALKIISEPHEIQELPNAAPLILTKGNIKFEQVDFVYTANHALFNQLSVEIIAGQKVGLVGYSGGGKSTFVKLLLRLHDVNSGRILIDDQDIKTVSKDSLRNHIGFIPQDTELFHRSVFDNIRYGRLEASEAEIIAASKKAHCHEFIEQLPEGYQSLVGERGIKLSGGQKQRIAIARAILKNAPILLLDEATSALDSVTERYIQESLHAMMENKTTIVIAHRLSTLSEMDRILFFKDGKIIEDGSFETLLKIPDGHFKCLWEMQAGGFIPDMPFPERLE